jgi:hypothetical protein
MLIYIFVYSMEKHIGELASACICYIMYAFVTLLPAFVLAKVMTSDYLLFLEDDHKPFDFKIIFWYIMLISSIIYSIILILLTILCQCCLDSEEYLGKRQKRIQLSRLSLLSSLLLVSKIGTLYEMPLLYIIPLLLFHAIPMLKSNSITNYYYTPEDAHYADTHSMDFFGCTRISNV